MQEFNKFRVITAGFILMFIFVIAAMYTNTKDIATQKAQKMEYSKNVSENTFSTDNPIKIQSDNDLQENDIQNLIIRLEQLEKAYRTLYKDFTMLNNSNLNCQIRGILDDGDVVPLSPEESIQEANLNNKNIVITCSVK